MPDYLPLCAFRQGLLPAACQSCAWWQTTGSRTDPPKIAAEKRRQWMISAEGSWGSTGLLLVDSDTQTRAAPTGSSGSGTPAPAFVASINFAPADALPRLRELSFGPLPEGSAVLFCLTIADGEPRFQAKRVLRKALAHLKDRGVEEAYAVARSEEAPADPVACRFFTADFLFPNGFQTVAENGELVLMRVDLRGLLSLLDRVETAVRRMLHNEPTPSPAAWTRRGT